MIQQKHDVSLKAVTLSFLEPPTLRPNHHDKSTDNHSWTMTSRRRERRRSCWEHTHLRVVRTKRNRQKLRNPAARKANGGSFVQSNNDVENLYDLGWQNPIAPPSSRSTWWKIWIGRGESRTVQISTVERENQKIERGRRLASAIVRKQSHLYFEPKSSLIQSFKYHTWTLLSFN